MIDEAGARVKLRVRREQGSLADWNEISDWSSEPSDAANLQHDRNEDELVSALVTRDDVEEVIARWTGIPVTSLKEEETQKLLRIEESFISCRFATSGYLRAGTRHSSFARRFEKSDTARRLVSFPRTDRCWQN